MSSTILGIIASSGAAAGGGASYESIASATGTGSSGTITFSSIPSTYVALQIRYNARDTAAASPGLALIRCNGITSASYASHALIGNGASATATGLASTTSINRVLQVPADNVTANIMGTAIIDILDYNSTTKTKTIRAVAGVDLNSATTDAQIRLGSGLFDSTSAITSISIIAPNANWTTTSTFALYGIKGA